MGCRRRVGSIRTVTSTDSPTDAPFRYTAALAADIEARWQDRWEAEGTFHAPNPVGDLADPEVGRHGELPAEKQFILDMFPYPSGAGLHVGHPLGYNVNLSIPDAEWAYNFAVVGTVVNVHD